MSRDAATRPGAVPGSRRARHARASSSTSTSSKRTSSGSRRPSIARGRAPAPRQDPQERRRSPGCSSRPGRRGLTVGTLGEAEVFAAAGLADLFLAYPVWAVGTKAGRLRALHDAIDLSVGVDSVGRRRTARCGGRRFVAPAARPGRARFGRASDRRRGRPRPSSRASPRRAAGLSSIGVFTHGGHGYRPGCGRSAAAGRGPHARRSRRRRCGREGFEIARSQRGSTPTMLDAATGPVTEIRAGTYLLGDRPSSPSARSPPRVSRSPWRPPSSAPPCRPGRPRRRRQGTHQGSPAVLEGHGALPAHPDAVIERVYDYHGVVRSPRARPAPRRGRRVIPNHVCPVVDLFDHVRCRARRRDRRALARGRPRQERLRPTPPPS